MIEMDWKDIEEKILYLHHTGTIVADEGLNFLTVGHLL